MGVLKYNNPHCTDSAMISFKETLGYSQVPEIHRATFANFHMLYVETERGRLEWLRSLGMHPLQAKKKKN